MEQAGEKAPAFRHLFERMLEHIIPCGSGNNNTFAGAGTGASAAEIFGIHIRDT